MNQFNYNPYLIKIIHIFVYIFIGIMFLYSCRQSNGQYSAKTQKEIKDSIAKNLFEQKCNVCHDDRGRKEADIIAPPFHAVKHMYKRAAMDKEDFIETMRDWTNHPDSTKTLMKPAILLFGVMPYQKIDEKELDLILEYIYNTDFPKPQWFDMHYQLHAKGIEH